MSYLGKASRKKVAVLLDFVQITSTPPIWTTCTTFFANMPTNLGRGLPLPLPPQIYPIYTVCEKWTKNLGSSPPLIWAKSKRTASFFCETFPKSGVRLPPEFWKIEDKLQKAKVYEFQEKC